MTKNFQRRNDDGGSVPTCCHFTRSFGMLPSQRDRTELRLTCVSDTYKTVTAGQHSYHVCKEVGMLGLLGILLILVQTVVQLEGQAVIVVPHHLKDLQRGTSGEWEEVEELWISKEVNSRRNKNI
ncbi:hypothetical protein E2C01_014412 [Portunus trituberculatus]|uniref:Uncharacterized protein n=1 Tax=Portunus trituberculatus TaxID=210409 RepID=A0A5B7DKE3_PORTR|nr:hypothetical protein [Portunus trituberculatus]